MYLTGYHGTKYDNGLKILSENRFNPSSGDKEWLGNGIYFYFSFEDAYNWQDSDAIIHSVIKIDDDEYLDIDTEQGSKIFNAAVEIFSSLQNKKVYPNANVQENQCAIMRIIWDQMPQIKAISASFPTAPSKAKTLIDKRRRRREFCVRDNACIKHMYLIRKDDLDD